MRAKSSRLTTFWIMVAFLASVPTAYWAGYNAGLSRQGPERWALAVVRKGGGTGFTWYDVNDPREAERLRADERRLKASGADYYLAKGVVRTTTEAAPDLRRVNTHR